MPAVDEIIHPEFHPLQLIGGDAVDLIKVVREVVEADQRQRFDAGPVFADSAEKIEREVESMENNFDSMLNVSAVPQDDKKAAFIAESNNLQMKG